MLTLSLNSAFTSSIHGIFGVGSFCSQIAPQNSTNFSISGMSPSCFSTFSSVRKKFFWSFWNMMLSFFLFPFSTYLSSFTFLHRSLFIIIIIIIISYRFLNVEVLHVVLSNSEYHFSAVFSNMYLRNKKMYIRDIRKSYVWFENMLITS